MYLGQAYMYVVCTSDEYDEYDESLTPYKSIVTIHC